MSLNTPSEWTNASLPSCASDVQRSIWDALSDSRLTREEVDQIDDVMWRAIEACRAEVQERLLSSAREILQTWISITRWASSEERISRYIGVNLVSARSTLEAQGVSLPDTYSVRDNGTYLVFHWENWEALGTYRWASGYTEWVSWLSWLFIKRNNTSNDMYAWDIADSFELNAWHMMNEHLDNIDANNETEVRSLLQSWWITIENPLWFSVRESEALDILENSLWLAEWEFNTFLRTYIATAKHEFDVDINFTELTFQKRNNNIIVFWWWNNHIWILDQNGQLQVINIYQNPQ